VHWNTPDVLRVDAGLLLWDRTPGAVTAPETKLLRAMQIAAASSVARLLRDQDHLADAIAILRPGYSRFTEGFDMADLSALGRRQAAGWFVIFWARADR
jgi:hypothetical protein